MVSGNFVRDKEYTAGNGYQNLLGSNKVSHSGLGSRGLLGKIGYRFNEDNHIELSHRQEKQYGERALREEFDFSQVFKTDRRTGESILDTNGNRIPNTDNNHQPRYRTLTQDTTNLEFKGGNFGFIDKIKTNVYRLNTARDEGTGDTKINTYGANLNLDSRLFDLHTLKYGVNWRSQESSPANGMANEKKT
nr:hypothetical protein [Neisseria iguanae]